MTLEQIDEMPYDEYLSWKAYHDIEPWGSHGVEILIAGLCQAVIAASGSKHVPKTTDMMPFRLTIDRLIRREINQSDYDRIMSSITASGIGINKNV